MRSIKLAAGFLLLVFFLSSCTQLEGINARAGENFTISLESNPTTGYSWQLAKPLDEKIVKLESSKYTPLATDRVGAGGVEKWTFRAVKKGTIRVSLKYVRPWEKDKPPVEEKTFLIRIDHGPQSQIFYEGILPCADCSGLKTELTLYNNGTYYLKETYLATRDGDKAHTSSGKYQRIKSRGRNIVQLNYDKPQEIYNFLVLDNDHLRVLDKELNEIDTPMNMTLERIEKVYTF